MRPVIRGQSPVDESENQILYTDYKQARDPLIQRIGDYCSYCEVALHSDVDVEHVLPKSLNNHLELEWSNFLLACSNCNSIKGNKPVVLAEYYWPDQDNTCLAFDYEQDRPPRAKISNRVDQKIAMRTLELTGLDRVPGHPQYSDRDRRWQKRMDAWGQALQCREYLARHDCVEMRETIVMVATALGFWSVWYQVFSLDLDMVVRLNQSFPGTAQDCFDAAYQPVLRLGGAI